MTGRPKSSGLRLASDADEVEPIPTTVMSPGMVDDLMDQTRDGFMHDLGDFGETALLEVRKLEALLGDEYAQVDSQETKVVPSGNEPSSAGAEKALIPVVDPVSSTGVRELAKPRAAAARVSVDSSRSPHSDTKLSPGAAGPSAGSARRPVPYALLVPFGTIVAIVGLIVLAYSLFRDDAPEALDVGQVILDVRSDPSGAEVVFDGQRRGKAPLELRLPRDTKRRTLRVEATGHAPYEVELATDTSVVLDVSLEPAGAGAAGGPKP